MIAAAGRRLCRLCAPLALASTLAAQQPATPAQSPAHEWRTFRGSSQQTGVSASTLPASLKLLWTYEAGETVESTAAIVDGIVYVGGGDGDLAALHLDTGAVKWKYKTATNLIGDHRRRCPGGRVHRRSRRSAARRQPGRRERACGRYEQPRN